MRIRWIALCAAGATAAALAAPAVSLAPVRASRAFYAVTLTGSQRSVVTRDGTTTDNFGCKVRHADRDAQTVTFASRNGAPVTISNRLPAIRFDLVARVTGSFHRETRSAGGGEDCVSAPEKKTKACGPARLPARLAIRPENRLGVQLVGAFVRARDRRRCATTLVAPDDFLVPSESRLTRSPAGAARIFVRGHLVERTTATGGVVQTTTVAWKLVLTRQG